MRRVKNIKVKIAKKPEICIGDHFIYKDIEWICLDIIDGNYLSVTAKVWKELPFDMGSYNNWECSTLRRVLHDEFLNKFNEGQLVLQVSDLTADNGDKEYGTCEDYVTILSCDQYRKYRDLVPHYPEWMWTLTPWSCYNNDGSFVRTVTSTGNIGSDSVSNGYGVVPACIFSSKILKSPHLGIQKPNQLGRASHK